MAPCLSFFFFVAAAIVLADISAMGHAELAPEDYWRSMLPNTPMPNSIRERLSFDLNDEKATSVNVGDGGVHVDTGKGKPKGGTTVDVGKGGVQVGTGKAKPNGGTTVGVGRKGVGVNTGRGKTSTTVGKGGVNVYTPRKGKPPVIVNVKPGKNPFNYRYAASDNQLHDDPNVALFFLDKDLHTGAKFNVYFNRMTSDSYFLPRNVADQIPFSSSKFPKILQQLSIEPKSEAALSMKETIEQCESPAVEGESKQCATSLESMIDYTRTRLGIHVQALTTEAEKDAPKQEYTIVPGLQKIENEKSVACHSEPYAYAVYYCHQTSNTNSYRVRLVGEDGTKVNAVAVCHKDTSKWNPKHIAFQVLKVKPGSVPVCHFIPEDHIVWVPNQRKF